MKQFVGASIALARKALCSAFGLKAIAVAQP